nr:J530 [uncultured bacterium]
MLVDGAVTEQSGRFPGRTYNRTATVKVPDRTAHTFQVVAEAAAGRTIASTTIACTLPPARPPL